MGARRFDRDLFPVRTYLVRGVDRGLVWLNILFILPVALVPATAALLGIYAGVPLLYFIGVSFLRRSAPGGSLERDFTWRCLVHWCE